MFKLYLQLVTLSLSLQNYILSSLTHEIMFVKGTKRNRSSIISNVDTKENASKLVNTHNLTSFNLELIDIMNLGASQVIK